MCGNRMRASPTFLHQVNFKENCSIKIKLFAKSIVRCLYLFANHSNQSSSLLCCCCAIKSIEITFLRVSVLVFVFLAPLLKQRGLSETAWCGANLQSFLFAIAFVCLRNFFVTTFDFIKKQSLWTRSRCAVIGAHVISISQIITTIFRTTVAILLPQGGFFSQPHSISKRSFKLSKYVCLHGMQSKKFFSLSLTPLSHNILYSNGNRKFNGKKLKVKCVHVVAYGFRCYHESTKHANKPYITYSSSICERNIWCCRWWSTRKKRRKNKVK